MYPYIEIFGKQIGTYPILAIIGLLLCGLVATLESKKHKIDVFDVVLLMVWIGIGLVIGGHALYGITNIPALITLFSKIGEISFIGFFVGLGTCFGGMVFYGGLFGAIAATAIHIRMKNPWTSQIAFDLLSFTIPLFHVFGRLGCFFGGCCYGKEWDWGFLIEENSLNPAICGVVRFPVALFEAGVNLLIFIFLYILYKKGVFKGKLIFVYLPIYAVARFILEFFRGDLIRGIWFGLSTSQIISIGILVFSIIRLIYIAVKKKKNT